MKANFEQRQLKFIDERYQDINAAMAKSSSAYSERVGTKSDELDKQIDVIHSQIQLER